MQKITVAHKWTKERNKSGEWKWKCETIKDERKVADIVHKITVLEELPGSLGSEVQLTLLGRSTVDPAWPFHLLASRLRV